MHKHNQHGFSTLFVVFIVGIAVIGLLYRYVGTRSVTSFDNGGYHYTLGLQHAHATTKDGLNGLLTHDGTMAITIQPSSSNTATGCTPRVPKVAEVTINGNSYPLCQSGQAQLYLTSFSSDGQWHNVLIVSPSEKGTSPGAIAAALTTIDVTKN